MRKLALILGLISSFSASAAPASATAASGASAPAVVSFWDAKLTPEQLAETKKGIASNLEMMIERSKKNLDCVNAAVTQDDLKNCFPRTVAAPHKH